MAIGVYKNKLKISSLPLSRMKKTERGVWGHMQQRQVRITQNTFVTCTFHARNDLKNYRIQTERQASLKIRQMARASRQLTSGCAKASYTRSPFIPTSKPMKGVLLVFPVCREVGRPALGYTASKLQTQNLNLSLIPKCMFLT